MSESATHYMCACDEGDQKAVECLLDWAPPTMPVAAPMDESDGWSYEEIIMKTKAEMEMMTPAQASRALAKAEDLKTKILFSAREVKARLQHKSFGKEKQSLQEQQISLQEQEAAVTELLADLTAKVNSSASPAIEGE